MFIRKFFSKNLTFNIFKYKSNNNKRQLEELVNFYKVLGVNRDSELDTIKAKFLKLAKMYHPDVNPSPDASK